MLDQRAASGAMQNLGKLGTHARPLARSQNHNDCIARSHVAAIVASPQTFGNRNSAPGRFLSA
jgi:hypothetical protein